MTIEFGVEDRIATIRLNRPEALNAMTPEMYTQLSNAWIEVRDNPEIWVAVVTGAPQPDRPPERQVFSAGADLKLTIPQQNEMAQLWQTQQEQILNRGLEVWKPVVAAINGWCLAGGMTMLLATDFRIGSEHSMYDLSEVKRGILPANGGTQRTVRQLPYPIAMEVLLLGRRLSAQRAAQFGLINEVVPHDQVMDTAMEYARQLREMPPLAVRAIKELAVRAHQGLPLMEGLRLEQAMSHILKTTDDAKEGPKAFAEKRTPEFHGR
ncbi:MAG: enoyl-CoA hydratase/isomerase family protein [Dehalococcoidia bacterium]|nr:enoyl-CoA hydratase/isomerase family protein [Dehalococcoidia bacterium]